MRPSSIAVVALIAVVGFAEINAARLRTDSYNDESSEEHLSTDRVAVSYHLKKRLTRFIRLGAMAQAISKRTKIPRNEVFNGGASEYQDITQSNGDHASHVVRVRHDNTLTRVEHTNDYVDAMEFLSHTHRVPAWANVGIGRMIDTIQSDNVNLLASIDFCAESPTPDDKRVLQDIKKKFLDAFDRKIQRLGPGVERNELVASKSAINSITPEYLFSQARRYGLESKDCN